MHGNKERLVIGRHKLVVLWDTKEGVTNTIEVLDLFAKKKNEETVQRSRGTEGWRAG